METKHTQGEWVAMPNYSNNAGYIAIGVNGNEDRQWIAEAMSSHVNEGMTDEEFLANAKLISAAPDLLEALTMLIEETEDYNNETAVGNTYLDIARKKTQKAIKKAKGE